MQIISTSLRARVTCWYPTKDHPVQTLIKYRIGRIRYAFLAVLTSRFCVVLRKTAGVGGSSYLTVETTFKCSVFLLF